jgi:hypothetical protein
MISGIDYVQRVGEYFSFLVEDFDFGQLSEKINGNAFYDIRYKTEELLVSISYENIEDYFQVIVYLLQDGELPDYDDKSKTLHLNLLTTTIITTLDKNEINRNNDYFKNLKANTDFERKLLKSAKDLRLCLMHL